MAGREERIPSVCGLWRNTYEALSRFQGRVKELVTENWLPRGVLVFKSKEWKEFLGKLQNLEVWLAVSQPRWIEGAVTGFEG